MFKLFRKNRTKKNCYLGRGGYGFSGYPDKVDDGEMKFILYKNKCDILKLVNLNKIKRAQLLKLLNDIEVVCCCYGAYGESGKRFFTREEYRALIQKYSKLEIINDYIENS